MESESFFEEAPPVVKSVSFTDLNISRPILKVCTCDSCVEYRGVLITIWYKHDLCIGLLNTFFKYL